VKNDDMPAPPRAAHKHQGCGDWCFCFTPKSGDCQKCRTKAFNDRMAARYREDSQTVEELLERRA
jgi:hypothetical protein